MKKIWKAVCAVAVAGMMTMPVNAEEKTITVGTMNWEDLTPITGITKKVLEDSGYTVKVVEFSEWGIAYEQTGEAVSGFPRPVSGHRGA